MTIYIHALSLTNALGHTPDAILKAWEEGKAPGARLTENLKVGALPAWYMHVEAPLPTLEREWQSRNNQLLAFCLSQLNSVTDTIKASVAASRIGVVLGTSTSASEEEAQAVKAFEEEGSIHGVGLRSELGDPSRFVAHKLGIEGPAYTMSTACTSSARAIMSGARLLLSHQVDAVLVGGADSLAGMPINGFDALGVLDNEPTRPLSHDRAGITIGEGAGLMWMTRGDVVSLPSPWTLLGWGESTDGYHMSQPEPSGQAAQRAMQDALKMAGLEPSDIAYINLHGTGTPANDSTESLATRAVFGDTVWRSSTKALTGHTLGAAGITDVGLCALLLQSEMKLPPCGLTPDEVDPACMGGIPFEAVSLPKGAMMSNNFAFGGNNTSLILGRSKA